MSQSINRRKLLRSGATLTAGALTVAPTSVQAVPPEDARTQDQGSGAASKTLPYLPVETPDVPRLPCRMEGGVKVFHLIPEPVRRTFAPGWTFDVWGYNGSMPGPMIEAMEGDRVRIVVENRLPEMTSMHWHGLDVPIAMDGVPGLTQDPIEPGETFVYEFDLRQHGTFFYHSHFAMQELLGLVGLFVIHPRQSYSPKVDYDFGIITQGWHILPTNTVPATLISDANWGTLNGRAGPLTTPMIVRHGSRVRLRLVNLSMDHHPMHLHGQQFHITGAEGNRWPEPQWQRRNTVILPIGGAQDIEFVAENLGDWMFHCHIPHHMMNWGMTPMVGPKIRAGTGGHAGMQGRAMGGSAASGPRNGASANPTSTPVGSTMPGHAQPGHGMPGSTARDPRSVPGYPQDMFMPMDDDPLLQKPENAGLRPGWSGGVAGMMTLVRVLPPAEYARIQALRRQWTPSEAQQRIDV